MKGDIQNIRIRRIEILEQIDILMDRVYQKNLEYREALAVADEQIISKLADERNQINNAILRYRDMLKRIDAEILLEVPPVKAGKLVDLRTNGLGFKYTIYLHDQSTSVGAIEYRDYHYSEYLGDIGYIIDIAYRNHGYATEALALLSEKLYEEGISDFWVTVYDENNESIRVIEKNGGIIQKSRRGIRLYLVPTKMRNLEVSKEYRLNNSQSLT